MDKKEGGVMNPKEIVVYLDENDKANKNLQTLREQQKERFIKLKAQMDVYLKIGTQAEKKDAFMINEIWGEFSRLWGFVVDLTELALALQKKVIIHEMMIDAISTQFSKFPEMGNSNLQNEISILKEKLEKLEKLEKYEPFLKHIEEAVKNSTTKKTEPNGMYR